MTTFGLIILALCAGYALCILHGCWLAYRESKRPITNPFLRRAK